MDINEYIQSGIIESYVLGLANTEEIDEMEKNRFLYPEIGKAITDFSLRLEEKALEYAIAPPAELKVKIFSAIDKEAGPSSITGSSAPAQAPVIPIHHSATWKMVAAASVILFITSAILNFYLFNRYRDNKEAYQALLSERQTLQANNDVYQTQLKEWQSAASMIADTAMLMVKMRSPVGTANAATVFWNNRNKDVYVMVNKLPEPKTGKQYQLWAIVGGKPVDAGMLNPSCTSVCKMKNIPEAQAFAITLEKEGGSPTPNLKALLVMGHT